MFYAHELNEWVWPRVQVKVTTFTQFAQTASLLALKVSMHYNFVHIQYWTDFQTFFSGLVCGSLEKKKNN